VGLTVDHETAHATNSFAAVMVEGDGFFALSNQLLIQNIQHLKE
jgi:hypothetical protein